MVEYEIQNRVARVVMDAPVQHNALSQDMLLGLGQAFARASQDDTIKVVVLAAQGASFCAGADLKALQAQQQATLEQNQADAALLANTFAAIYTCPKLVLAQVQGAALAGGCGLVSLCDVVFAHTEADFGCPEVRIGFVPAIIMRYMMQRIGMAHAKWMLLSGARISATQAQQMGLVQQVFESQDALIAETQTFCQKLVAKNSSEAMQATKALMQQVENLPLNQALPLAQQQNALLRSTAACQRGVQRFLNKEPLDWQDA